jgi:hypothetical protein
MDDIHIYNHSIFFSVFSYSPSGVRETACSAEGRFLNADMRLEA